MDFEMDPFTDLFSEPGLANVRAGAKFQPKARPRCKKEVPVLVTKDKPVKIDSRHVDASNSVSPTVIPADLSVSSVVTFKEIPCSSTPNGSSSHLENQNHVNNTAALHPEYSMSDGDRSSAPVDVSSQCVTTEGDVGSTIPPFSGDMITSSIHVDKQTGFGRSGGETADIFSGLDSLDDILSPSTISNVTTVTKFQPKVKVNGQPRNKLPISRPVTNDADCTISCPEVPSLHASMDLEKGSNTPVQLSVDSTIRTYSSAQVDSNPDFHVSQELLSNRETATPSNHGDMLKDDWSLEREEDAFHDLQSVDVISHVTTTTGDAHLVPPEYVEVDLTPAYPPDGFIDFSTMEFADSAPNDASPELQVPEEPENLADASGPEIVIPGETVDSQAGQVTSGKEDERSVLTANGGNETSKSSRQHRKRSTAAIAANEKVTETRENQDLPSEPSTNLLVDDGVNNDDDDEDRGEEKSNHKRARKIPKKPVVGNEKTVRSRKRASEGSDSLDKEPPKKKFSHSTRRNRRQVDKALLETPEEEIDPRKLIMKDLILLAETRERLFAKDANVSKNSIPNQSNYFAQDAHYNDEDPFGSTQGQFPDDEQAAPAQRSSFKLNYHSFMDRTPKERWSKQDTELFYQGIRQFGTDFAMIQQLFPGRTRHQVKLKYKKEERQQPLRLSDALTNRPKDHSHFELVIERLQKAAAEAEQDFTRDEESIGVTGGEEISPETNEEVTKPDEEGGAKSERKEEEAGEADMEAEEVVNTNHAYSPTDKPHHESEEEEDVYNRWSQYKSDYDVF